MSLKELRDRITHALLTITADMLHRVGEEFDYRVDVCRVTQGAHIEGLWLTQEKLGQLPLLTVYVVPVYGEK
jgi:xanthine dehydrogenase molybdopterin-binding subunit B